ncbi:hypothetical protein JW835_15195 [bacterium]|nr:hypothetical protein [bacterium]
MNSLNRLKNNRLQRFEAISLFILCFFGKSFGQAGDVYAADQVLGFADYLYDICEFRRAANEYLRYEFLTEKSPQIQSRIGLCFFRDGQYQKAIGCWRDLILLSREPDSLFKQAWFHHSYAYFRLRQLEKALTPFEDRHCEYGKLSNDESWMVLKIATNICLFRWQNAEIIFRDYDPSAQWEDIHILFQKYMTNPKKYRQRSPFKGALLSAFLPGSGKVYANRTIDGILTVMVLGAASLNAYRGFERDGMQSIRGWIFGGISTVFYFGNIYGSAVAVRVYNRQLQDQVYHDIQVQIQKAVGY